MTLLEIEKEKFLKNTIPFIEKEYGVKVVLAYVRGSQMYGTARPTSDVDVTFVYQQPLAEILKANHRPQINVGGDDLVGYEIQRFIELLAKNNPNILEALDIPEDCIILKDDVIDVVLKKPWLSKLAKKTFLGYADSQVKKATGLHKNMNNPQPKDRKDILDFCYIMIEDKSIPFKKWFEDYKKEKSELDEEYLDHNNWGLSKYPVGKGMFSLWMNYKHPMRGLVKDNDSVNLRVSEISEDTMNSQKPQMLYYNLDGFQAHCKQHAAYWKWVDERNEERFKLNEQAGQNVDLKNMMHLFRLLEMCKNIAEGKGIIVRSKTVDYLNEIRDGKYPYQELLAKSEEIYTEIKSLFETTDLPNEVDIKMTKDLLLKIRINEVCKDLNFDSSNATPEFIDGINYMVNRLKGL